MTLIVGVRVNLRHALSVLCSRVEKKKKRTVLLLWPIYLGRKLTAAGVCTVLARTLLYARLALFLHQPATAATHHNSVGGNSKKQHSSSLVRWGDVLTRVASPRGNNNDAISAYTYKSVTRSSKGSSVSFNTEPNTPNTMKVFVAVFALVAVAAAAPAPDHAPVPAPAYHKPAPGKETIGL